MNRFPAWLGDAYARGDRSTLMTDVRFLVATFFLLIIAPFFMNHFVPLIVMLFYVAALHVFSRLPAIWLMLHLKRIALFVILVIALNMAFVRGDSAGLPPPLSFVSKAGIRSGALYGLRILLLYVTASTFLLMASRERIAGGIAALLAPVSRSLARKIALYGFVSLGFLPVFSREIQRIHIVQHFRGGAMRGRFHRRLAAARLILVPLLVSAVHRSAQMATIIELRQLKERVDVFLVPQNRGKWDLFWFAASVGVVVVAIGVLNG